MEGGADIGIAQLINILEKSNGSRTKTLHDILNGTGRNKTYPDIDAEAMPIGRSIVLIIAYGVLITVALFGNILVCHVIFSRQRMRTVTNIFIANLAVSDLMLIILNAPFNIAKYLMSEWMFGSAICHIMNMSLIASVYASTFTLTVIALDRQRVLLYPLRPRILKSGGLVVVAIIWVISIILALPFGIYSRNIEVDLLYAKRMRCRSHYPSELFEQVLTVVTIILQYVIPLSIIAVTYGRIVRRIWERTDLGAVTANQHACRSKHKKKSIKMLLIVVIVFAICWMPLNLYHILTDLHPDIKTFHYDATTFFVCHWLAISSTCYNPFIYCWLNEAFRAEIRAVFRCCCPVESGIFPRDQHKIDKMDSLSQTDSMSLQINHSALASTRRFIFRQKKRKRHCNTPIDAVSEGRVCNGHCSGNVPCYCLRNGAWRSENIECTSNLLRQGTVSVDE